jgi:hypothetical protein
MSLNPNAPKYPSKKGGQVITGAESKKLFEKHHKEHMKAMRTLDELERHVDELSGGRVDSKLILDNSRAMADPFNSSPTRAPVHNNPAPSLATTTGRSGDIYFQVTVTAGTASQVMFRAHGTHVQGDTPYAFNGELQSIGNPIVNYVWGPSNTVSGKLAICALVNNNLTIGYTAAASNVVTTVAVQQETVLPYNAVPTDKVRYQLTAMGVRGYNITEQLSRGGSVCTVCPDSRVDMADFPNQGDFAYFPNFQVHGDGSDGFEQIWVPHSADSAFWYSSEAYAGTSTSHGAMYLFLNNTTTADQTYILNIAQHWELAGSQLRAVNKAKVVNPANRNVVEPARDAAYAHGATAHIAKITKSVLSGGAHLALKTARMLGRAAVDGAKAAGGAAIASAIPRLAPSVMASRATFALRPALLGHDEPAESHELSTVNPTNNHVTAREHVLIKTPPRLEYM